MEWLNYHHLRYFWSVAKEGSLRLGAEKLNVSQPSVSAQIRLLEEALGHPLFLRRGRRLHLTDSGKLVLDYAEVIFSTGRELVQALQHGDTTRTPIFNVGITDSLPKLVVHAMLEPALRLVPAPRIMCREGQLDELLPLLASHRLDLILAGEPVGGSHRFRIFNHSLGRCGVTFCASPKLAARLRKGFPKSLEGAPVLLPTEGSPLRRPVEHWFMEQGVRPQIVGEFDDAALMQFFARDGTGFLPLHSIAVEDAQKTFRLTEIGVAPEIRCHLHAITAERRLTHPAIVAVTTHAQTDAG